MRFGHGARQLESRNRLFARDGGETFEKLVERITGFEVVEQRLDGYSRSNENGSAAENLWVAVNDSC